MPPAVVMVVMMAAQLVMAKMQADDQKKAAKRQAEINKRAVDNKEQQRLLAEQRQKVALAKQARAKRADIINSSAQDNSMYSTSFRGAFDAIQQNANASLNVFNQQSALAGVADDITREQIDADASAKISNANNQFLSAVVGVGSKAAGMYSDGAFGSTGGTTAPAGNAASNNYGFTYQSGGEFA